MKKYNVGVIGYGWAATAHIDAINHGELGQVTAVYSSRNLNADELSARHGSPIRVYNSVDDLVADPDLDAVSITSYPWEHAAQAVAAAKAGKHIILEKPFALSMDEIRTVEAAVKEAGVNFCICFECRFSSQFRTVKSVLDAGLLGRLHYGEIDYFHGVGPWYGQFRWNVKKSGGGSSLLSAGCHAMDALLLCMGDDVEEVTSYDTTSKSEIFAPYEYPTTSVTILKFKDGRIGKCASSIDCLQPYYFHTHLIGSEGSLLDNKFHSMKLDGTDRHQWSGLSMKLLDSGDVADHPYQTQFDAFFRAIEENRDMPLTGLRDAVRTHEVIFAADRSAAEGRTVKLSEMQA